MVDLLDAMAVSVDDGGNAGKLILRKSVKDFLGGNGGGKGIVAKVGHKDDGVDAVL